MALVVQVLTDEKDKKPCIYAGDSVYFQNRLQGRAVIGYREKEDRTEKTRRREDYYHYKRLELTAIGAVPMINIYLEEE